VTAVPAARWISGTCDYRITATARHQHWSKGLPDDRLIVMCYAVAVVSLAGAGSRYATSTSGGRMAETAIAASEVLAPGMTRRLASHRSKAKLPKAPTATHVSISRR
jgi:hypothetical protein